MKRLYVSLRGRFSTAHFYNQKTWDAKTNKAEFGLCFSEYGHGHNYNLDVTFSLPQATAMKKGECDGVLREIKSLIDLVLQDFDHRHLNFTHPAFNSNERISTTEVLAEVIETSLLKLWQGPKLSAAKFHGVQVWETSLLAAASETSLVSLARPNQVWSATKLHRSTRLSSGESRSLEILLPPLFSSRAADFLNAADGQFPSLESLCCTLQEKLGQPILMNTKSDYFLFASSDDGPEGDPEVDPVDA